MNIIGRIFQYSMLAILVVGCANAGSDERPDANPSPGRPGDACNSDADCAGIPCSPDKVCCNTRCAGLCETCSLPDSVGTCMPIPDGEDPDDECGNLSCDGYFQGWNDYSCHVGTPITADQAACNGDRACRSLEEECTLSEPGAIQVTCDSTCQVPDTSTCAGTTGGTCINIDQGLETCGEGACAVTTPRCVDGAPAVCEPDMSASTPEVCNDIDDDCDGRVDDDWAEPNDTCAEYQSMVPVNSPGYKEYKDLSINGQGDHDYFRVVFQEGTNDSDCECCDAGCTDEDYAVYLYLTAPEGIGSYMFCTGQTCGADDDCVEVPAGGNKTLSWFVDGSCAATDSYELFVHVYGGSAPGYACEPYWFTYEFVSGCYGVQ